MKTTDDLKTMLAQWRIQFPNLYLRAIRGDCSVTILTNANPLTQEAVLKAAEVAAAALDLIEEPVVEEPVVVKASYLHEIQVDKPSNKVKKERKAAKRKLDPSNFPM